MSIWTMLRCDYRFCRRQFRTTLHGAVAETEAAGYGWTKRLGEIRCPDHKGLDNQPRDKVA